MRMLDVRRPIDPREHAGTAISVLGGAKCVPLIMAVKSKVPRIACAWLPCQQVKAGC